ncbi:hypothetical protein [Haloplanus pelagicus]|uniref:hypothetical protein n=1 Tax=Haloplanus pelagicus TaxID=2949995 RepID=UPI0020420A96|nr:hypothetical protein [Haloplanus sp. HW8-1]
MAEVHLSDSIYERVQSRVDASDFEDADEYVEYVVATVLDRIEGDGEGTAGDREEVMDKLRDLGYLE